jgi:hypothetical protein
LSGVAEGNRRSLKNIHSTANLWQTGWRTGLDDQ